MWDGFMEKDVHLKLGRGVCAAEIKVRLQFRRAAHRAIKHIPLNAQALAGHSGRKICKISRRANRLRVAA